MAYKPLICKCGNNLLLVEIYHERTYYEITETGERSEEPLNNMSFMSKSELELECDKCRKKFPLDMDGNGDFIIKNSQ